MTADTPFPHWPDAPRWCPAHAMPLYRYVPGINPHPTAHREGHSFGIHRDPVYVPPERWRENEEYLFGIDLYHRSYFWEAHEVWEGLWKLVARDSTEGMYYQGLIQNAAAQLKAVTGVPRGVRTLSLRATGLLANTLEAIAPDTRFMGVELPELLDDMRRHYGPMWGTHTPDTVLLDGAPPRIRLAAA